MVQNVTSIDTFWFREPCWKRNAPKKLRLSDQRSYRHHCFVDSEEIKPLGCIAELTLIGQDVYGYCSKKNYSPTELQNAVHNNMHRQNGSPLAGIVRFPLVNEGPEIRKKLQFFYHTDQRLPETIVFAKVDLTKGRLHTKVDKEGRIRLN